MSNRLNKARAAFEDAVAADHDAAGVTELERKVFKLLDITRTQAALAGAEALEELLEYTVRRWGTATFPKGVERYHPTETF